MKKIILLAAACIVLLIPVRACDVCGCGVNNSGFGYLPLQNRSIISLAYDRQSFHSDHPVFYWEDPAMSIDRFNRLDLWMRFSINERWMVSATIPYKWNSITIDGQTETLTGPGDFRLTVQRVLLSSGDAESSSQTNWIGGIGAKLPSGNYRGQTGDLVLPNLQTGTGSYDLILQSNLSFRYKKVGVFHEMSYSNGTPNPDDYKYGSQLNQELSFFYQWKTQTAMIIPQFGLRHTYGDKDYESYSNRTINNYSGIQILSAKTGIDLYANQFGFRLNASFPLMYNLSGGYITPKPQWGTQVLYFINLNKK